MTVTADTPVADVVADPAAGDWGRLMFPVTFATPRPDARLRDLDLPWYTHVDPRATVDVVTDLLGRARAGERVFIPLYSPEERAATEHLPEGYRLEDVGLFVFPAQGLPAGERGPVAVVCAGGGFAYVAAMHDSFPHCLWLSRHGVSAFALVYRPDAQSACEDLARAISYIFHHADELGVDPRGYSLWGGSAGGRMAAYLGSYGPAAFGGGRLPKPACVVMEYTGHSDLSADEPANFVVVGDRDPIASWRTMENRSKRLRRAGVPTEFHVYEGLSHGFGLGTGTVAEGWIGRALAFWLAHRFDRLDLASAGMGE